MDQSRGLEKDISGSKKTAALEQQTSPVCLHSVKCDGNQIAAAKALSAQ